MSEREMRRAALLQAINDMVSAASRVSANWDDQLFFDAEMAVAKHLAAVPLRAALNNATEVFGDRSLEEWQCRLIGWRDAMRAAAEAQDAPKRIWARLVLLPPMHTLALPARWSWQLFQGEDCVGTAEAHCKTRDGAMAAARRWSDRYGYGSIVEWKDAVVKEDA